MEMAEFGYKLNQGSRVKDLILKFENLHPKWTYVSERRTCAQLKQPNPDTIDDLKRREDKGLNQYNDFGSSVTSSQKSQVHPNNSNVTLPLELSATYEESKLFVSIAKSEKTICDKLETDTVVSNESTSNGNSANILEGVINTSQKRKNIDSIKRRATEIIEKYKGMDDSLHKNTSNIKKDVNDLTSNTPLVSQTERFDSEYDIYDNTKKVVRGYSRSFYKPPNVLARNQTRKNDEVVLENEYVKLNESQNRDGEYVTLRTSELPTEVTTELLVDIGESDKMQTLKKTTKIFDGNQNIRMQTIYHEPVDVKNYIVNELVETEEGYIESMEFLIQNFKKPIVRECSNRPDLIGKHCYIFGNIEEIYLDTRVFLTDLKKCGYDYNEIGKTFLKHKTLFQRYIYYCQIQEIAQKYLSNDFKSLVQKHEDAVNAVLDLRTYLLRPIQRMAKYEQLLVHLSKRLLREKMTVESIVQATTLIKETSRRANDLMIIQSIKGNNYSWLDTGDFLLMETFKMVSPKKLEIAVFVFRKRVLFATKHAKDKTEYQFKYGIELDALQIFDDDNSLQFCLKDFNAKKKRSDVCSFILEALDVGSKTRFTKLIYDMLWSQLVKMKVEAELNFD